MPSPISEYNINLRLFIDTNVIINYINNYGEGFLFLNIFKENRVVGYLAEKIELVTSDYVIWELCEYLRHEHYLRNKIVDNEWPTRRAIRGVYNFNNATQDEMSSFGQVIKDKLTELGTFIQIEKVMNKESPEFNEYVLKCICESKFQAKDILVITSAIFIGSHKIVTEDDDFRQEGHRIKEIRENLEDFPVEVPLNLNPAIDFSNEDRIKKTYERWFVAHNGNNVIGDITNYWSDSRVIGLKCTNDQNVKVGDYIYIVKFVNHAMHEIGPFRILDTNIRDYDTDESITEGDKVTIKIPDDIEVSTNLRNSMIFLYEL